MSLPHLNIVNLILGDLLLSKVGTNTCFSTNEMDWKVVVMVCVHYISAFIVHKFVPHIPTHHLEITRFYFIYTLSMHECGWDTIHLFSN